jgi:hypothetical protein
MAPLPPSLWNCCHCCAGVIVALAPLPSLLGHCCRHGVGVLAVVAMYIVTVLALAPSPVVVMALLCHRQRGDTGVIPRVALAQLPSLQLRRWRPCGHRNSAIASVTLELLLSLHWRHCCAGTVAIVAWALSTSRCWHPCDCRNVHFRRLGAGAIAVVVMALLLPSRQCCHRRHQPGACAIINVVTLASLLLSPWRSCHRRCCSAGVLVDIAMALLPVSLERYCCCGTGVVIPVALAHCLGGIALATPLLEMGPRGASQPLRAAAIPRMSCLASHT